MDRTSVAVGQKIYEPTFVRELFDQMSKSYERTNRICSFGFSYRWRKQGVSDANPKPDMVVHDLMCGMGETWSYIFPMIGKGGTIKAVDFCDGMLSRSTRSRWLDRGFQVEILKQDVLEGAIADQSVECLICLFGIKTFSLDQQKHFANEIARILKPGGTYALVEVSVPPNRILRLLYMFYLKTCVPIVGRIFLGDPENYRMLGVYTEKFGNASSMNQFLGEAGLITEYREYFYGCATGVRGEKIA